MKHLELVGHRGTWVCSAEAGIEINARDARIAQVEAALAQLQLRYHAAAELHSGDGLRIAELEGSLLAKGAGIAERDRALAVCDARIAELEKQAAIDKTMLALADARINRELRDDFAGRAMAALLPAGTHDVEKLVAVSWGLADEMLKAKGGA